MQRVRSEASGLSYMVTSTALSLRYRKTLDHISILSWGRGRSTLSILGSSL